VSSIIQGYEYDIFISYRHNDNLDGWVTDFVQNLDKELRATLKDQLSIYFDKNPHDGLLETHNVDKSLVGKLKCLIFIPIISQTYCDAKSFAWQHEFCAFNKLAMEDQFGRDIRLSNGNVASRILPIKIHDLDEEDKMIIENEIGGALRAIEFIFKSAGVNRPLRPGEEHPQDNANRTFYRDQVNKVANAIKQIVTVLKNPVLQQTSISEPSATKEPTKKKSIITTAIAFLLLVMFGYVIYTKIFSTENSQRAIDKSIAVLPFTDISDTQDQAYFSEGMMVEILDHLFKIKDLRIIPRNSTLGYKDSTKPIKEIASELSVAHLIQGSVRRAGSKVKISVALVEGSTEKYLWQHTYEDNITDVSRIFIIQSDVAAQIAKALQLQITPDVKERMEAIPTKSQEA
jgi:TolB-like protein